MVEPRVSNRMTIENAKETIQFIRLFDKDLNRRFNKAIKAILKPVKERAESKFPEGEYVVGVTKKNLLGYVAARGGTGFDKSRPWSEAPGGVKAGIYEFFGSSLANTPDRRKNQVAGLLRNLDSRFGSVSGGGRILWDAWDEVGEGRMDMIAAEFRKAEREMQAKLDALGEGY